MPWLPDGAEQGVQAVLLSDERWAEPGLAGTVDLFAHGVPAARALAAGRSAGMLARQAQQIVPASRLAPLDQGPAGQPAIGNERAVGSAHRRSDTI